MVIQAIPALPSAFKYNLQKIHQLLYTFTTTEMGQIHNTKDKSSKPKEVLLVTSEFSFGEIEKLLKDLKHQHPHIQVEILGKNSLRLTPSRNSQSN